MTSDAGISAERSARLPRYSVVVPARGLALLLTWVVITLLALVVIDRAGQVIELLLASVVAAVIVGPAVRRLATWMPRALGLVLMTVVGVGLVAGAMAIVGRDLDRQAGDLASTLHEAIGRLPSGGTAADLAQNLRLDDRIDRLLHGAAARVIIGDSDPLAVVGQVGQVIVVAVLAAFIIIGGGTIVRQLIGFVRRASTREQLHVVVHDAATRGGAFLRRTFAVSVLHGVLAGFLCYALGLPGYVSLGAWVALMVTVPIVGGVLAWLPVVVITSVSDHAWQLALAAALVCVVLDRLVRRRWVDAALRVGPLLALLGIGVGLYVAGLLGAVIGLFVVAAVFAGATSDAAPTAAAIDLIEDPSDRHAPAASNGFAPTEPLLGERRPARRLLVHLSLSGRTLATISIAVLVAVVVVRLAGFSQQLLIWLVVGVFIAVGLDRPVSGLQRRFGMPRVASILVVLCAALALVTTIIVVAGPSIVHSFQSIAADAPDTVKSMEKLPIVGHLLHEKDASKQVEDFLADLPNRVGDSGVVERVARAAGDGITGALWIVAIMLAVLLDGPRLVDIARGRIPVGKRMRSVRFGRAAYTAFSNVVAAAAFVAALNGTVVMLLALAFGIPLAPVLGVWAAIWNFIPQIGGFVGALPLVALGLTQGPWTGLIVAGCFVTYQTFENHVLQPFVGSRVVHVPPLVILVGAMFGGALAGFVGALMAGPVLGVAKVALDQLRPEDRTRIEDRQDGVVAEPVAFAD